MASREIERSRRQESHDLKRKRAHLSTSPTILIVCEGESKGFNVAYSNQAFEYWIILHFSNHQGGAMDRNQYGIQINRLLRPFDLHYDHEGAKDISDELFNLLFSIDHIYGKSRSQLAIERSKIVYNRFDHSSPATEESSTTMHLLVEHLMEFQRY